MPINDAPHVGGNKEFADQLNIRERRSYPDVSKDQRLYRALNDVLGAMTAAGPDADEAYSHALHHANHDEKFVHLVLKTLDAVEESAYPERWALLQLTIDLRHPATGDYLSKFVRLPIPKERSKDPVHGVSTVTEEVILRTTAIEGLSRLFSQGYDSADVLLDVAGSSDYVAMRRAAWFALVDRGREDDLRRARELLEKSNFGWIADLKRVPVQEAEQHDPKRVYPPRTQRGEIPPPFNE
jgi:hypothetical protein